MNKFTLWSNTINLNLPDFALTSHLQRGGMECGRTWITFPTFQLHTFLRRRCHCSRARERIVVVVSLTLRVKWKLMPPLPAALPLRSNYQRQYFAKSSLVFFFLQPGRISFPFRIFFCTSLPLHALPLALIHSPTWFVLLLLLSLLAEWGDAIAMRGFVTVPRQTGGQTGRYSWYFVTLN